MTLELFLSRFAHVRPHGPDRWTAACPAHEDRSQDTLSLAVGRGGRWLVYCWAGCASVAVLEAVGLTLRDCFADDAPVRPAAPPRPPTYPELVAQAYQAEARRRERLYRPYVALWEASEVIGDERATAARLRALAGRLDPEACSTWNILELAAFLDRSADTHEAALTKETR